MRKIPVWDLYVKSLSLVLEQGSWRAAQGMFRTRSHLQKRSFRTAPESGASLS